MVFYTKKKLYSLINNYRKLYCITTDKCLDMISFCKSQGIAIDEIKMVTPGLRALCIPKSKIILLNEDLNAPAQNFHCAHEFIHLIAHSPTQSILTSNEAIPYPSHLEWQANEGAAELLMPMRDILAYLYHLREPLDFKNAFKVATELAEMYNVPYTVASKRIENLGFEFEQYSFGLTIEEIEVLSHTKQKEKYPDFENPFKFSWGTLGALSLFDGGAWEEESIF
ncbi:hypothetical protein AwErysi_06630 [Erysipelotrichaceae bacterium]|nr:hypothetical protein AwErysi_06630 [Erysipelotrichaceae bacterium]